MVNFFTILTYNTENFYPGDNKAIPENSGYHYNGEKRWGNYRYLQKVKKISNLIAQINKQDQNRLALIGLQEIGSEAVLDDLCSHPDLSEHLFICAKNSDHRGLTVGLIYNPKLFKPLKTFEIQIFKNKKKSRPILIVEGIINHEEVVVIINHWPSKRDLSINPIDNRKEACNQLIDFLITNKLNQKKLFIIGDFNENPGEQNILNLADKLNLENPMQKLFQTDKGSSFYFGRWTLFDQILNSRKEKQQSTCFKLIATSVYKPEAITSPYGRGGKNTPFRTYRGQQYLGGLSDHFPVWAKFTFNKKMD